MLNVKEPMFCCDRDARDDNNHMYLCRILKRISSGSTGELVEADAERDGRATELAVGQRSGALAAGLVTALQRRVDRTLESDGALLLSR